MTSTIDRAIVYRERVDRVLELLRRGLGPFVQQEFTNIYKDNATIEVIKFIVNDRLNAKKPIAEWDVSVLLSVMWESWYKVFSKTLERSERTLVRELLDNRHRWAHQKSFSFDDTYRVLDSAERLLTAISATQVDEIKKMKNDLWLEKSKSAESVMAIKDEGSETTQEQIVDPLPDSVQIRHSDIVAKKDQEKHHTDTPIQRKQSRIETRKSHAQGYPWNHNKPENQDGFINGLFKNNITFKEIVNAFAKRFPDHANPAQRVKRHIDHLMTHRDFPYEKTNDGKFVPKK